MSAEVLVRAAGTLERVDRTTLVGRYLPWDEPADVVDLGVGGAERYREGFRRGAVDHQLRGSQEAQAFIQFVDGHEAGLGKLGYTLTLADEPDGLYGQLRVHRSAVDDVEQMLNDGITGLSVGFVPRRHVESDGVRWRTDVRLQHVALVPRGAYESAQVIAWRQADDERVAADTAHVDTQDRLRGLLEARDAQMAVLRGYTTRRPS